MLPAISGSSCRRLSGVRGSRKKLFAGFAGAHICRGDGPGHLFQKNCTFLYLSIHLSVMWQAEGNATVEPLAALFCLTVMPMLLYVNCSDSFMNSDDESIYGSGAHTWTASGPSGSTSIAETRSHRERDPC